jgi:hypothetical protein
MYYGAVCAGYGDRRLGSQCALQSEAICDRFRSLKYKGKCLILLTCTLLWWIKPLSQVFPVMDQSWQLLLSLGKRLAASGRWLPFLLLCCWSCSGDYQWAGYQLNSIVHTRLLQGVPMLPLLARIPKYLEWCTSVNHVLVVSAMQAAQLVMLNLLGATNDDFTFAVTATSAAHELVNAGDDITDSPSLGASPQTTNSAVKRPTKIAQRLAGMFNMAITEAEFVQACVTAKRNITLAYFYIWKARALYIHGHIDDAWTTMESAIAIRRFVNTLAPECELVFGTAMITLAKIGRILDQRWLALRMVKKSKKANETPIESKVSFSLPNEVPSPLIAARSIVTSPSTILDAKRTEDEDKQISEWWPIVDGAIANLNLWSSTCGENFHHMSLLVQAEAARWKRKPLTSLRLFGRAIEEAKRFEFNYHEALGAERFSEFFIAREDLAHAGTMTTLPFDIIPIHLLMLISCVFTVI